MGHGHAADGCMRLDPRGDVHAVAKHIAILGNDVALMHADAEVEMLLGGGRLLNGHGAMNRLERTGKTQQESVAHLLEPFAAVLGDQRLE